MILGFHHLAVQARDVARVAKMYLEVLGLSELKRFHRDDGTLRSIWVSVGAGTRDFIAIESSPSDEPAGILGYSMVALRIAPESRSLMIDRLSRHGVVIEKQTEWTMYVRDPEGNLVGLSHYPEPAPSRGPHL
jgi:glyoxylase I family protein